MPVCPLASYQHLWLFQYLVHRTAPPARTAAQDKSPNTGDRHQAAVLEPPAEPADTQTIVAEFTRTWPVERVPRGPPSRRTSLSRASRPFTAGQGWRALQLSSISRAATPAILTFGPSAHHIGPSPSQTVVGVQAKVWPAAITAVKASIIRSRSHRYLYRGESRSLGRRGELARPQLRARQYSWRRHPRANSPLPRKT